MAKLLHSEQQLLRDWARLASQLFNDKTCYHVGTSLSTSDKPTYRDVDVRVMLEPNEFKRLAKLVNIDRLNLAVSLWGQKTTGMPIDFQIQDRIYANEKHKGSRSAVSITDVAKGDGTPPIKVNKDKEDA